MSNPEEGVTMHLNKMHINPVRAAMRAAKAQGLVFSHMELRMPTTRLHGLASHKRLISTNMDVGMSALGYELRQDLENPFRFEFVKVYEPKLKEGK